jgi:adenylyl-sulfate kinase
MSHRAFTLWLTGLSGAGKSTLAHRVEQQLKACQLQVEVLDGDVVRRYLSQGLGFSAEDRAINVQRIAFVCHLLTRNGVICVAAAISPYRDMRARARQQIGDFIEVYVRCPLEVCRQRDVKGLYRRVAAGEIRSFTGVDDPYEEPEHPDLVVETDRETVEESVARIFARVRERGYLQRGILEDVAGRRGEGNGHEQ